MKVLVAVKRVVDAYAKIRVKSDGSGVDLSQIKMSLNPFDEIAIEAAVRLKESGIASEVVAVSIGSQASQDILRQTLALGADHAVLVETGDPLLEPINIAKILKAVVDHQQPQLVILGKQAIDGDNNQTGQMLAALLGWPQGTFISDLSFNDNRSEIQVTREIDGGLETLSLSVPAVLTTDLRLNEPRYASLPNIMKAKKKPLVVITPQTLGVTLKKHCELLKVVAPEPRKAGVKVENTFELIQKLRDEAKVI